MKRTLPILSIICLWSTTCSTLGTSTRAICLWFTVCSTLFTSTPAPTAVVINAPTLPPPMTTALPPRPTAESPTTAIAPTLAPTVPEPTPTVAPLTHTVQSGENLFRIALRYGVTVEALRAANGIVGDTIYVGQVLIIPHPFRSPAPTTGIPNASPPAQTTAQASSSPITPASLAVKSFAASPNPVDRNAQLTLNWDVAGAASVTLWPMTYDRKLGRWFRIPAGAPGYAYSSPAASGSAKGQWTMLVPSDARYSLRFELEATDASGAKVVAATDVIDLTCYPSVTGSGYCPFPAQSVQGAYQPFEQGLLIWRGDTQQIFILSANQAYYIPWSLQAAINSTNPLPRPPTGLFAPADRFAGLWSSFRVTAGVVGSTPPESRTLTVAEILGWATGPEQIYPMTMQLDLDNTQSGILSDHLFLSLADGRVASLVLYGSADGTTGPGWHINTP